MSSPHYISTEAIDAYCRLFKIEYEEDVDYLLRMISLMDDIWIEDWTKKEKARQRANSKPSSSGRRL